MKLNIEKYKVKALSLYLNSCWYTFRCVKVKKHGKSCIQISNWVEFEIYFGIKHLEVMYIRIFKLMIFVIKAKHNLIDVIKEVVAIVLLCKKHNCKKDGEKNQIEKNNGG